MKLRLLALAIAASAAFSASAAPIFSLGGYTGGYSIKMRGYESFTGAGFSNGDQNYGVLKVTSIVSSVGGSTLWADGDGGAEITGAFSGITLAGVSIVNLGGGDFIAVLPSTGGTASFFINPVGSFTAAGGFGQGSAGYAAAACAINTNCYNGISNVAGGGSLLDVAWRPGIVDNLGDTTTVLGSYNTLSSPDTGTASGYLDVVGGAYATMFDTNGIGRVNSSAADMFANNRFCPPAQAGCLPAPEPTGDWQFRIDDPIDGTVRTVSEPVSLALASLTLMVAGIAARRRRSN